MWALVKFVKLYFKTNRRSNESFVVWPELTYTFVQKDNNVLLWVQSCQRWEPVYPPKTLFIKTKKLSVPCPALTLHLKAVVFLLHPPPHSLRQVGVTARSRAAACSKSRGENLKGCRAITTPVQHSVLRLMIAICKFLTTVIAFKGVDIWMPVNLTSAQFSDAMHQDTNGIVLFLSLSSC